MVQEFAVAVIVLAAVFMVTTFIGGSAHSAVCVRGILMLITLCGSMRCFITWLIA